MDCLCGGIEQSIDFPVFSHVARELQFSTGLSRQSVVPING